MRYEVNKNTPITDPLIGKEMKLNLAGGYAFAAEDIQILRRFLLMGNLADGFYETKNKSLDSNIKHLTKMVFSLPGKVAEEILFASEHGTMASQHTCLLALVFLSKGSFKAKSEFKKIFNKVVRTASHLYEFMNYVKEFRGMGKTIHKAIKNWLSVRSIEDLEFQFLKYQQRGGFSGRDVLRLIKPIPRSDLESKLFAWIVGKNYDRLEGLEKINAYEKLKKGELEEKEVVKTIHALKFTHEMIPSNIDRTKNIWKALYDEMPIGATLRNLGNLTEKEVLLIDDGYEILKNRFSKENIKKGRLHPITITNAYAAYNKFTTTKSKLQWVPDTRVNGILEDAILNAFECVEPSNKHFFHALDVSKSMSSVFPSNFQLSTMQIAGIMALATAKVENNFFIGGFSNEFTNLSKKINKNTDFKEILNYDVFRGLSFSGTNASSAYNYALKNKIFTDVFVFWTDNESWLGDHPSSKLKEYRRMINPQAKAVYITLKSSSDNISLVDPSDKNSFDFAGFSDDIPKLLTMIAKNII